MSRNPTLGAVSGQYFADCNIAKPRADAEDPSLAKRLWDVSAAFEAIAATMPLGSVSFENETNERGERLVDRRNCHRVPALRYYS